MAPECPAVMRKKMGLDVLKMSSLRANEEARRRRSFSNPRSFYSRNPEIEDGSHPSSRAARRHRPSASSAPSRPRALSIGGSPAIPTLLIGQELGTVLG